MTAHRGEVSRSVVRCKTDGPWQVHSCSELSGVKSTRVVSSTSCDARWPTKEAHRCAGQAGLDRRGDFDSPRLEFTSELPWFFALTDSLSKLVLSQQMLKKKQTHRYTGAEERDTNDHTCARAKMQACTRTYKHAHARTCAQPHTDTTSHNNTTATRDSQCGGTCRLCV